MIDHLSVRICGKAYAPRKLTHIPKRYIWISDEEVLRVEPIPLLIVECIRTGQVVDARRAINRKEEK